MLQIVITVIHILACLFLVLVVLLQTGKGAEMGAVFGGSSSTVFGSSGAGNFLTRLTTAIAIVFMLTSLSLTYFGSHANPKTVFDSQSAIPSAPESPASEEQASSAPVQAPAPAPMEENKAVQEKAPAAAQEAPQPDAGAPGK